GTGLIFVFMFNQYGNKIALLLQNEEFKVSYSGAGASVGIIIAELFSLLFIPTYSIKLLFWLNPRPKSKSSQEEHSKSPMQFLQKSTAA
ncbi:MAG: hypothetical protein IJE28_02560, partial [Oscillospiraceae bacterium]|nr:hypothetical protein [Oscillospiraceae bacterium]